MEILGSSLPFVKEDRKRDSGQNVRRLFVITIRQLYIWWFDATDKHNHCLAMDVEVQQSQSFH